VQFREPAKRPLPPLRETALWLALLCLGSCLGFAGAASAENSAPAPQVLEIHLDGVVQPISADFVTGGIQQAIDRHDTLVLLQLSTPGGLDDSMRQIIEKIIQSPVPVVGYVAPSGSRAASAGFFILLSTDVAAMAPGTNTGAAHPVLLGGTMDEVMKEKVTNDAAAYLRTIAGKRGRDVTLAQTGVTESKSFTEDEALKGHLIDLIAANRAELLTKLDGMTITRFDGSKLTLHLAGAQVEVYSPSFRQTFLSHILDPNVAFILLVLGLLGLYVEFTHPGLVLPGVAGGIALVLSLFALSLLPVNWVGAVLILLAIVFFVLEAKFATHGILAAGGVLSMVLGALMLINTRLPGGGIALWTALAVSLPFAAITVFLLRLVLLSRQIKVTTGAPGMVGEIGRVAIPLSLEGKVWVQGELWDARSAQPVPAGASVRVKSVEGLKLEVEPLAPAATQPEPTQQPTAKGV
jgi:membrane-bound serine protease (ClpP class)